MFKHKVAKAAVLAASAFLFSGGAHAGGGTAGATEATQIANNVELVAQLAQQVLIYKKQLEQYSTQLQQFARQNIDGAIINNVFTKPGHNALARELTAATAGLKAFESLHGSVSSLSTEWQKRLVEASTAGISVERYIQIEAERIRKGNENAIKRMETEKRMMTAIEEDYALAKTWGSNIESQSGINQSLGLLNTQMNRMLQQNARIVEMMSREQGIYKAREEQMQVEKLQQAITQQKRITRSNDHGFRGMMDAMNKMEIPGQASEKSQFDFPSK